MTSEDERQEGTQPADFVTRAAEIRARRLAESGPRARHETSIENFERDFRAIGFDSIQVHFIEGEDGEGYKLHLETYVRVIDGKPEKLVYDEATRYQFSLTQPHEGKNAQEYERAQQRAADLVESLKPRPQLPDGDSFVGLRVAPPVKPLQVSAHFSKLVMDPDSGAQSLQAGANDYGLRTSIAKKARIIPQ